MIVQHNMTALNANRQLGITNTNLSRSTEKLSSGYRINRASDDAAGLSISEKMRGQIRGLKQASTNAQDGQSLIQTAEGAMNEIHSVLQRMRELVVQAKNDTYLSEDREKIQTEMKQLQSEITRIATQTQFNKMNLLNGSFQSKQLQVGAMMIRLSNSASIQCQLRLLVFQELHLLLESLKVQLLVLSLKQLIVLSQKFQKQDLISVLFQTDLIIQSQMLITWLRTFSLQRARFVM